MLLVASVSLIQNLCSFSVYFVSYRNLHDIIDHVIFLFV
jgi:hypothetical protein